MVLPTFDELIEKKVNDLIEKYSHFKVGLNICHLSTIEAKQCALILCDEILNDGKMMYCGQGAGDKHYEFWERVKASLNAL